MMDISGGDKAQVKVYLETMGCQMNRLDSELVAGVLCAAGHEMVDNRSSAEVVLYNTCCVRQHAEQKVYSRLGADAKRKAHKPDLIVGVLGCMAQNMGQSLIRRFPHVDIVCAPGRLGALVEMIESAVVGEPTLSLDPKRGEKHSSATDEPIDYLDLSRDPHLSPQPGRAYVRVARGCDNFCSYCIVPYVRGPERSRSPEKIAEEVRRLIDAGRSEITLLGQTVNRYLWNDGGRTVRFSDLLECLSSTPGLRRLRFVTSYPLDFGDDILQAMRDMPNVCEYIHIPAQSGSDAVLKRMNRKYTRRQYEELIDRARETVPRVAIAGDFIVGFCGETEADHQASADLIRRSGYKNSFIFKYSPRPGTTAAERYEDDVTQEVKKRRNNELLAVQAEVGLANHRAQIGRVCEVLVEGPSPRASKQPNTPPPGCTQLVGRTRGDYIVVFNGPEKLAGRYVDVKIADATSLTLFGSLSRTNE